MQWGALLCLAAMTLLGASCARPEPSFTMDDGGCRSGVSQMMTGREVIAVHNRTDDIVAFDVMHLEEPYDAYAAQIAAIEADIANAPSALGKPATEVGLPASGIPYGDQAVLEADESAEMVVELDESTYAMVCRRYGPLQATIRGIAVVGPLQPGE